MRLVIELPMPTLERAHIERLEAIFPPRCKGRRETEDDHLRYAGKVELVQSLRAIFDEAHENNTGEQTDEFVLTDGQSAR